MTAALAAHWRIYLAEALGLFLFMVVAGGVTTLVEYPGWSLHAAVPSDVLRRICIAVPMALTIAALVYHPWGQRSGAQFNPAVTLAFWQLGRISAWDAIFYVVSQFAGALIATPVLTAVLSTPFAYPRVRYGTTQPGPAGEGIAFVAEFAISFVLMILLLGMLGATRFRKFSGGAIALLILFYVVVESPLSGMSLNPARTFGAAVTSGQWHGVWLYFAAPIGAMSLAALMFSKLWPNADLPRYPDFVK